MSIVNICPGIFIGDKNELCVLDKLYRPVKSEAQKIAHKLTNTLC